MRIFIRANEILVANVTEVIERSEDPARLARLIVGEIEEAIIAATREASRLKGERAALAREVASLETRRRKWAEKARFAMSKDRLDLAKGALTESEKDADVVAKRGREGVVLDEAIAKNAAELTTLNEKLNEARERQRALRAAVPEPAQPAQPKSRTEEALGRVDILEQRVAFAEARFGRPEDREAQKLARELSELDMEARVEASLAAMMAKAAAPAKAAGKRR